MSWVGFRIWLAEKIMPSGIKLTRERYHRLRHEIEGDRWWLGTEFPEVHAFATRLLCNDDNYARKIGEPARDCGWSHDISQFREQMRRGEAKVRSHENH